MLPLSTLIATSCQLSGIGGAALFGPTFLLIFPLFDLSLSSPAASVASALLTEVFGFASGLTGYARRGLVDWETAGRFIIISAPSAFLGAKAVSILTGDSVNPIWLRGAYSLLMLSLCAFLTLAPRPDAIFDEECDVPEDGDGEVLLRSKTTADGITTYNYLRPKLSPSSFVATVGGGSLTGLLGVGIGEVILPQLVRISCMPVPLAAGTSVAVVIATALTAACVQFLSLAESVSAGGSMVDGLAEVVPWNLVKFTIPGVLLGGQIAPYLAGKGVFKDEEIETFAAGLFGFVGVAFLVKALVG